MTNRHMEKVVNLTDDQRNAKPQWKERHNTPTGTAKSKKTEYTASVRLWECKLGQALWKTLQRHMKLPFMEVKGC